MHVPRTAHLDINLSLPDSVIGKIGSAQSVDIEKPRIEMDVDLIRIRGQNAGEALRLKKEREFDVDGARAQWVVDDHCIILWV